LFQAISANANVHAQFQAVTIGATWRFAPPPTVVASTQKPKHLPPVVVTNPWEGFYVGGRVGGDWGNGMSATSKSRAAPT
jgi:outer membrane immunogenic protein